MSDQPRLYTILCGELCTENANDNKDVCRLSYYDIDDVKSNISIKVPKYIDDINLLPPRIIDLLEIAAYVFTADRSVFRGERKSLHNESWERSFLFKIPVRDIAFWNDEKIKSALAAPLKYMTGDRLFSFKFSKYKSDPLKSNRQPLLFDTSCVFLDNQKDTKAMLFSGGLDSLAGAIDFLNTERNIRLLLIGHRANTSMEGIQDKLVSLLKTKYGSNKIMYYGFECHNKNYTPTKEETQRTRMFLFSAISFSICNYCNLDSIHVYENGITSINFPKQGDVFNARASRTTHPRTIGLLQTFYQYFTNDFSFNTPYINKTKADIMQVFSKYNETNLIQNTVSCSSTRTKPTASPHCGCCSQCIDRRLAVYATELDETGATDIYESDFIRNIPDDETKQRLYMTLRFAAMENMKTQSDFMNKYLSEITDIIEYWPGDDNPENKVEEIYNLICRYGDSVLHAVKRMQTKYNDLLLPVPENSLLAIIDSRDYLKSPIMARVLEIDKLLQKTIPVLFQREKPKNENDFNDKIQAVLSTQGKFDREYPALKFGITNYRADHSQDVLLIESKYIRGKTSPSVATEGIASDITQVPNECGLLFVVYDPERSIISDDNYIREFENKRENCYVRIYR